MSSMQQPPVASQPGPSPYQPPREPNISARTLVAVIGVVFVILIAFVLVLVLMGGGGGSSSPNKALEGYASEINNGDLKGAFDHTIIVFMPGYDDMMAAYDNISFEGMISVDVSNIEVVYEESMTQDQLDEVESTLEEINITMDIDIQDTAIVTYTMSMEIYGFPMPADDTESVVVKVGGDWYLAIFDVPGFFDY